MTPRAIPHLNYVFLATRSRTRSHFRSGSSNCERFPVKGTFFPPNIALFPELLSKTLIKPFRLWEVLPKGWEVWLIYASAWFIPCARDNLMFPRPSPGLPFNVSGGNQPADSLMKANMMIRGVACVSLVAYMNWMWFKIYSHVICGNKWVGRNVGG